MSAANVPRLVSFKQLSVALIALLLLAGLLLHFGRAYGDQLPARSIQLGSAQTGAPDTYKLTFTIPQIEVLGSVRLQFCAESPLIGQPCSLPAGMNLSSLALTSQTPAGAGFTLDSVSGTDIILTRTASSTGVGSISFTFSPITNPSTAGSYFGRIQTYASTDGSGASNDYGGLAFAINDNLSVTATVPPYLYFCMGISVSGVDCNTATGNYINFGTFTPAAASVAQTQMVAGTNADTGYFIVVNGNTLTSGTNVITALASPDISRPGVSQFGMNLVANSDPQVGQAPSGLGIGQPTNGYKTANAYKFGNGDVVASTPQPDEARRYTTSYVANVSKTQAPGIYVTTLTYVATGGF